uniref:Uncharacterized protein n=1 Tax=Rhizophora mucronata TaxID=61149 RepID=A0A2P2NY34_RHIMU
MCLNVHGLCSYKNLGLTTATWSCDYEVSNRIFHNKDPKQKQMHETIRLDTNVKNTKA